MASRKHLVEYGHKVFQILTETSTSYCLDNENERVHVASILSRRLKLVRQVEEIYKLLTREVSSRCLDDEEDRAEVAALIARNFG